MESEDKKESLRKALEQTRYIMKNQSRIQIKVFELVEAELKKDGMMKPHIAWMILKDLISKMEKVKPEFLESERFAEKVTKRMREGGNFDIPEARIRALSREKNKRWLGGHKAKVIVGSPERTKPSNKRHKCMECKEWCYTSGDDEHKEMAIKRPRYLCGKCILDPKWDDKLNAEQRKLIERAYK